MCRNRFKQFTKLVLGCTITYSSGMIARTGQDWEHTASQTPLL